MLRHLLPEPPNSINRHLRLDPQYILLIGLLALAVVGFVLLPSFGASTDEWVNSSIAWEFIHLYETNAFTVGPEVDYFNGTFFFMVWVAVGRAVAAIVPSLSVVDGRHFVTFVTFLVGLWLFFKLALRFLSPRVSLIIVALFATQPLLFGHAFVNQKDTPLMVFFLASVVAGWAAVDRLERPSTAGTKVASLRTDWQEQGRPRRAFSVLVLVLAFVLLADLWITKGVLGLAEQTVRDAYRGHSFELVNRLFTQIATDAYKTPVYLYIQKLVRAAYWLRWAATIALSLVIWFTLTVALPNSLGRWMSGLSQRWGLLILAAILVGVTTAIRVAGLFAGVLVAWIALVLLGRRSITALAVYASVAFLALYAAWPALWGDPASALVSNALGTPGFTTFNVIFQGRHFPSTDLPWFYLPWLLAIQLTLPAVGAIVLGFTSAVWRTVKGKAEFLGIGVLAAWAGVPSLLLVTGVIPVYNNFRHVLFCLVPLFVFAGIGLDQIAKVSLPTIVKTIGLTALLVPGIAGIVRLHPYEYTYYNALVGGVDGAAGSYELDYWCTSGREAMRYVNSVAQPGARVAVQGSLPNFTPFARDDLDLYHDPFAKTQPDIGILCNRHALTNGFPTLRSVYTVNRERAVMAVVKAR